MAAHHSQPPFSALNTNFPFHVVIPRRIPTTHQLTWPHSCLPSNLVFVRTRRRRRSCWCPGRPWRRVIRRGVTLGERRSSSCRRWGCRQYRVSEIDTNKSITRILEVKNLKVFSYFLSKYFQDLTKVFLQVFECIEIIPSRSEGVVTATRGRIKNVLAFSINSRKVPEWLNHLCQKSRTSMWLTSTPEWCFQSPSYYSMSLTGASTFSILMVNSQLRSWLFLKAAVKEKGSFLLNSSCTTTDWVY